jgi:hypothetical protein
MFDIFLLSDLIEFSNININRMKQILNSNQYPNKKIEHEINTNGDNYM